MTTRRTLADILTDNRDRSIYAEARRRGESPALALYRVRTERACHDVLASFSDDTDGGPYGPDDLLVAYDVDPVELTRHTAGPVRHVTLPDGTHPDGTVTLPEGATVRLFVYADHDTTPEDDCYSPKDVAAWCDDQWRYVGVSAVVTLADGTTGESALWGVDQGAYWPGSDEADIWHAVPDLIADAADQAQTTARKAAEREQASAEAIRRDALEAIASALPTSDPAPHVTRANVLVALDAAGLRIVRK